MLQRSMEKKRSGQGGFTLVELLVVIAILGILATIVVFAVAGVGDKGQAAADKTTCSVLRTAEEAYFASPVSLGTYTASQDVLKAKGFLHTTDDQLRDHARACGRNGRSDLHDRWASVRVGS